MSDQHTPAESTETPLSRMSGADGATDQPRPDREDSSRAPAPEAPEAPGAGKDRSPPQGESGSGNNGSEQSSRNPRSRNRKRNRNRSRNRNRNPDQKQDPPREVGDQQKDQHKQQSQQEGQRNDQQQGQPSGDQPQARKKTRKERYQERKEQERAKEAKLLAESPATEAEGMVEISPKGFGFLRESHRDFNQSPKDVFITPELVRIHGLRDGLMLKGVSKKGLRGPQLVEVTSINGREPEEYHNLPYFEELTAINPDKKLTLETKQTRLTTRVIDLVAPIGRGQRGLIVAPPRTGKTTLLHHIAEAIQENYDEMIHLMVLLVDERPEEVTDFQRSFPDVEVFSSSNDSNAQDHTRMALLAIERAKRLVEAGEHVFILMDSITRLARAFNSSMRGGGRGTASGGLTVGALDIPRRIFAAARNTREAGSLTIVATALIQTNSKADEAIFQEFKGTGNMELLLDRELSQNYVYPAVDIHKSGTRREELLLPPHMLEKIHVIRRGLGGHKPVGAMEWLLKCMERYPSNAQMLMDIKTGVLS